jgi:hypothetical protein
LLTPNSKPRDIIDPEGWVEYEGTIDDEYKRLFSQQLEIPEGTIAVTVNELRLDGTPNIVRYRDNIKEFLIDPVARIVSLKMKTTKGRSVNIEQSLPQTGDKRHMVFFMWNISKGGALDVDQIYKGDMEE